MCVAQQVILQPQVTTCALRLSPFVPTPNIPQKSKEDERGERCQNIVC